MTDDPDEFLYEQAIQRKKPEAFLDAIENLEHRVRTSYDGVHLALWIIILLLGLIAWRIW